MNRNYLFRFVRLTVWSLLLFLMACGSPRGDQAAAPRIALGTTAPVPQVTFTTLGTPSASTYTENANDHAAYHVIDLQARSPSVATAINNDGAVVGEAESGLLSGGYGGPLKYELAFLWYKGKFKSIGALPLNPAEDFSASIAYGINNRGQIVGGSGSFGPGPMDGLMFCSVFVYKNGTVSGPFVVYGTADESEQGYGVNDLGTIVGSGGFHGFVYSNGVKIEISPLSDLEEGNGSVGIAVNNSNEVVGATTTGKNLEHPRIHAFLWRHPKQSRMVDLGSLSSYPNSIATAINDNETVVGYTTQLDTDPVARGKFIGNRDEHTLDFQGLIKNGHAFVWRGGVMEDLGVLKGAQTSAAFAINDGGAIVGESDDRAVIWINGVIHNLNNMISRKSGWTLVQARAINNRGWIVGFGTHRGEDRAYLLVPRY